MIPSRTDFSLLILVASSGSFQISGFSSSRLTSSRRSFLLSKSKIPPKVLTAFGQVFDLFLIWGDFHDDYLKLKKINK